MSKEIKNLRLFNTETRKVDRIASVQGAPLRLYTCGPTVYDYAHIGNFRTYVAEDVLRRTLKFLGYGVIQVMNITDIDDKTISGALAQKRILKEYTEPFRLAFFEDLEILRIERAEYTPAATEYIPEMIRLIQILIEKGHAYCSSDKSIYFKIQSFPQYGRLSHLNLQELKFNASGDNRADEYDKDSVSDFVLWKAYDPVRDGTIFWESPFGLGRPGWHIECSAMAMKLLGPTIDIHCGGVDNMFPHHENEIAQSECVTNKPFSRHWFHVEHLLINHQKMSKSLNNFFTLRDLLKKGYTGSEVRYLLLSSHYRTQLNFTLAGLDAARASLQRLGDLVRRLKEPHPTGSGDEVNELILEASQNFEAALVDDLNTPAACAALFELIRFANILSDDQRLTRRGAERLLDLLKEWDRVFAVIPFSTEEPIPYELTQLLSEREEARKHKNFDRSDELRKQILDRGYIIEDTPSGARLKRKL